MKSIIAVMLALSVGGCATTGAQHLTPTDCQIQDGYCSWDHVVKSSAGTATEVIDVYAWDPKIGWCFSYREVLNAAHGWWSAIP